MDLKSIAAGRVGAWLVALLLAGCGGGGGTGGAVAVAKFTIGVSVSGLPSGASIVLQDNGGDNLTVTANGAATFATGIANGGAYAVTVATPPSGQTCSVSNGAGTVNGANVSGVAVACAPTQHFAYVVACGGASIIGMGSSNGSLSVYTVDATSGLLAAITGATYTSEYSPATLTSTTIDPSGRFLYVTDQVYVGPGEIMEFGIGASTGLLSRLSGDALESLVNGNEAPSPSAIAVAPNGKFAYVANAGANNVAVFGIDAASGVLTQISNGQFATDSQPMAVAVNPNGNFVYAANSAANDLTAFAVNAASGALTPVAGSPFAVGAGPNAIAVSMNGKFVYVANGGSNNIAVLAVDATTGALAPIAGSPFASGTAPTSITIAPNGNFAYVTSASGVSVYALDATSGVPSAVVGSPFAVAAASNSVTFGPGGKFAYLTNASAVSTYSVNVGSGILTPVGSPIATGAGTCAMAIK